MIIAKNNVWLVFLVVSLFLSCTDESSVIIDDEEIVVTTAAFEYAGVTDSDGKLQMIPVTVSFTNQSINADSYLWDFGDGTTSTDESPTHIYELSGNYTVSLTATGPDQSHVVTSDFLIGVPEFDVSFSLSSDPGVTEFTVSYNTAISSDFENATTQFYLELSLNEDFATRVEFLNDQTIEPVIEEELLNSVGTFTFKNRMPDTTYYARIKQVVDFEGVVYDPLYTDLVVAKMNTAPIPTLIVENNESYEEVGMTVIATVAPLDEESFLIDGGHVELTFSYTEDFSELFVPQYINTSSVSTGVFQYWKHAGTTIYIKGAYDLNGREVSSEVIEYTVTDNFLSYFTSLGEFFGSEASYSSGTNILTVGSDTGQRFTFLLPSLTEVETGIIPLEVGTDKMFFYDESNFEYTLSDSDFNDGVALQIYRVSDGFLYGRVIYESEAGSIPSLFFQRPDAIRDIIHIGLTFKAAIVN